MYSTGDLLKIHCFSHVLHRCSLAMINYYILGGHGFQSVPVFMHGLPVGQRLQWGIWPLLVPKRQVYPSEPRKDRPQLGRAGLHINVSKAVCCFYLLMFNSFLRPFTSIPIAVGKSVLRAEIGKEAGSRYTFISSRAFATETRKMSDLTVELTAPNGRKYQQPIGLFINNEWVKSSDGEKITSINPT